MTLHGDKKGKTKGFHRHRSENTPVVDGGERVVSATSGSSDPQVWGRSRHDFGDRSTEPVKSSRSRCRDLKG